MNVVEDISVVFLYVADLARSLSFYRDTLGLPFGEEQDGWIDCRFPSGVRFALHQSYPGREPQVPGTAVVSFAVRDVDEALAALRAAGADAPEPTREEFGTFAELSDPDGYRIQLFALPA